MPKTLIRHIAIPNPLERERVRLALNRDGFYALTNGEGIDVYVIDVTPWQERSVTNLLQLFTGLSRDCH